MDFYESSRGKCILFFISPTRRVAGGVISLWSSTQQFQHHLLINRLVQNHQETVSRWPQNQNKARPRFKTQLKHVSLGHLDVYYLFIFAGTMVRSVLCCVKASDWSPNWVQLLRNSLERLVFVFFFCFGTFWNFRLQLFQDVVRLWNEVARAGSNHLNRNSYKRRILFFKWEK